MNAKIKMTVVGALAVAIGATIVVKQQQRKGDQPPVASIATTAAIVPPSVSGSTSVPAATATVRLPRLVDLGADKCIPCKMMAPILEGLQKDYAGKLTVEFIDVWKFPNAAGPYNIKIIPTQIFFDASGKELFRHEGFFSQEDILAKWKECGYNLAH